VAAHPGRIRRVALVSAPRHQIEDPVVHHQRLESPGATGEYRLINRPRRLVFSWTFAEHPENHQLIELEFSEHQGATSVVMINSGISTEQQRSGQQRGWHACYDNLERTLSATGF